MPGIKQNNLMAVTGKIMFNFITVDHRIMGENLLNEDPKPGDVPLPVAKIANIIADSFLWRYQKRFIEAMVCGKDLQIRTYCSSHY